jgi:hypothetical protein
VYDAVGEAGASGCPMHRTCSRCSSRTESVPAPQPGARPVGSIRTGESFSTTATRCCPLQRTCAHHADQHLSPERLLTALCRGNFESIEGVSCRTLWSDRTQCIAFSNDRTSLGNALSLAPAARANPRSNDRRVPADPVSILLTTPRSRLAEIAI